MIAREASRSERPVDALGRLSTLRLLRFRTVRCPHCMSSLRVLFRAPDACPHCERSLKDSDGATLRAVDKDFDSLLQGLDDQSLKRLKSGTLVCAVLSGCNAFGIALPFLLPILPTIIAIQQIVWARPLICAPYAKYFSPSRRIVSRWLSRFFVFTMASLHVHGMFPGINLVQIITSPIIFVITCGTSWAYFRFHLQRERDRQPVLFVEKVLLVLGAFFALLALAGLIGVAMLLGGLLKSLSGQ